MQSTSLLPPYQANAVEVSRISSIRPDRNQIRCVLAKAIKVPISDHFVNPSQEPVFLSPWPIGWKVRGQFPVAAEIQQKSINNNQPTWDDRMTSFTMNVEQEGK